MIAIKRVNELSPLNNIKELSTKNKKGDKKCKENKRNWNFKTMLEN